MESTKDYSKFKEFSSNRDIDPKHVNRLVKAITKRNLLVVNPIVVDKDMKVIDGQHRLAAAEKLGVEIFWVMDDTITRKDISMLNTNQKNWSQMDYINFYTIEKIPSFMQLTDLINHFPEFQVSSLISLANSEGRRNSDQLHEGYIDVLNIGHAKEVANTCKLLKEKFNYDFVFDSKFPLALSKAMQTDGFKFDALLKKIEASPREFVPCHTKKLYLEMIEEVYNRNLSTNKIRLA